MKIETHSHLLLAKDSKPSWEEILFRFKFAKTLGLDVLCITEHLDADVYPELIDEIFIKNKFNFIQVNDGIMEFNLNGPLLLSAGAEVSLKGGADVGVHASPAVLLKLNREKGFYSVSTLHEHLSTLSNDFIIVAHHVYKPGKWIEGFDENISKIDAIEVPAKDPGKEEEYIKLAHKYNMPTLTGSDAHTWLQIGIGGSVLKDESFDLKDFSVRSFKSFIKNKKMDRYILPEASKLVSMSGFYKSQVLNS